MGRPAVFLDRDGTIIEDRGHLRTIDEVHLFPDTIHSLRQLARHFELFIVTHQPGVSRGLVSMDEVDVINNHVCDILSANVITIRETYVCPHDHSENCRCIKPLPFFSSGLRTHTNLTLHALLSSAIIPTMSNWR